MSCEEVFFRQLREHGFRLTPQREMVLSVLHDVEGFATADEIHGRVSRLSSSVDISTVYRTLELLQDFHLVASVDPGDGLRRYELLGIHGQHFHLVCRACGKIIGVEPHAIEAFTRKTRQDHDFRIDLEHLTIPGLCSSCVEAPVV
ncbi:MAG: Fur family transcriptional regulator [Anaerolineae bacterium]|jgi:Fur family ferric uptake transcriptional regulator